MGGGRSDVPHLLGALLLLAGGAIHTWLAFDGYGTADLETLFLLNGAGSAAVAAAVALSRGPFAPLAGVGISGVSLLAFALSRVGDGVVGFRAAGLDPAPEAPLTLLFEFAALLAFGAIVLPRRRELIDSLRMASRRSGERPR